jgi:DNA-binding transcriptional regulator LsrR (DeoR family)
MSTARDRALIVKVARMYYEQNMSQDQIARALLTSRSNVSRILSVAKKRGIVEIKINEATKRETDIEELLISRFGLHAAMVAKVPRSTSDYKAVGQLAIQSFLSHLKPRVKVAVSWGRSIQAMVDALEPENRPDLTFIPLMGGMTAIPSSYSGEALIQSLAEKFNAQYQVLHAPTIVQSPDIKVALMREPSVAAVIRQGPQTWPLLGLAPRVLTAHSTFFSQLASPQRKTQNFSMLGRATLLAGSLTAMVGA